MNTPLPMPGDLLHSPRAVYSQRALRSSVLLLAALLGVLALLFFWRLNDTVDIDDAPITYRYAENLAAGRGFVYNPGERVQGTSTPLYTLLLAGLRLAGAPVQAASNVINILASAAVVVLVFLTTWRVTGKSLLAGLSAVAYLLLQGPFLHYSTSGMETPVYMALIVGAFCALTYERTRSAALLAGLCALTRLDGLAAVGAVLLTLFVQRRRIPWQEGLIAAAPLLVWFGFAYVYFGAVLPQSFLAKRVHYALDPSQRGWFWAQTLGSKALTPPYLLAFAIPGALLAWSRAPRRSWVVAPVSWLIAYTAAYSIASIPAYEWYVSPIYPVAALLVGAGLYSMIDMMRREARSLAPRHGDWLAALLGAVTVALLLLPYVPAARDSQAAFTRYLEGLEAARVRAGNWLRDHTAPDAIVFAGAIGHVGYLSNRFLIDGASLVTPNGTARMGEADYMVGEGWMPTAKECGPLVEFSTGALQEYTGPVIVSACHQQPWAQFGDLVLAQVRVTNAIKDKGNWLRYADEPQFESQWLIDAHLPAQAWTLFVHVADAQGNTLTQADHQLGRQLDGSVAPLDTWDPDARIVTYTPLPDDWAAVAARVASLRVGLWNPATGEHLAAHSDRFAVDESGALVIPIAELWHDLPPVLPTQPS